MSGVLPRTTDRHSVTFAFPVAIPPPPLAAVLRVTIVRRSDVVPRLENPPPSVPVSLRLKTLPMTRVMPPGCVLMPPPLIPALLRMNRL